MMMKKHLKVEHEPPLPWDQKPPFCIEENCEMLINPQSMTRVNLAKGFSGCCCGVMKEQRTTVVEGEVDHSHNEVYLCYYTPFKGWIKLMLDENDVFALELCLKHIRQTTKLDPP